MLEHRRRKKRTGMPLVTTPLLPLFVFIIGFGAGYQYYDETVPTVFSSTTEIPKVNVCFSPEGQCEKLVLHAIKTAEREILVQCYSFTSKPIAKALMNAYKKGVKVMILFDGGQLKAPYSQIHTLGKGGLPLYSDNVKGIAHNKVMIIDRQRLITGSYNFSYAANYKNSENMLYINDPDLAIIYRNQWIDRVKKSSKVTHKFCE